VSLFCLKNSLFTKCRYIFSVYGSCGQKAMWAFAITWHPFSVSISHLNLFLWNLLIKWTEAW
jgi:hypothetical protein